MRPTGGDDPNRNVLTAIEGALRAARDAKGRLFEVVTIPSPGRVEIGGVPVAASHLNFYVSNLALIMPCYGRLTGSNDAAIEALEVFENHMDRAYFFAIDSSHLLTGGGSFHCISQQQPAIV